MDDRARYELVLMVFSTLMAPPVAEAQGCFTFEGESRTISLAASGVNVDVSIRIYADDAVGEGIPSCIASTNVELSSFPTSRLALRPRDVAEAIRDAADTLGATECRIMVWYVNDTQEEFEDDELCKTETFRYDKDSFWSSSAESNCWEPA